MNQPLVTCIMPTANRPRFIILAINNFLGQNYGNRELLIVDDGIRPYYGLIPPSPNIRYVYATPFGTIGRKRNFACENAKGDYIVHWDDDDSYAPDWISKSVEQLSSSGADITGLKNIILHSSYSNKEFVYQDNNTHQKWLCGATLSYRKSIWLKYQFADLQIGEDVDFLFNSGGKISVMDYTEGFLANLHADNTSIKVLKKEINNSTKPSQN